MKKTLIIFLSARGEEFSQLAGFQAGANDYITKVIKPKVLISKVNALMELTTRVATQAQQLKIGSLTIDKDNFRVTKGTQQFFITKERVRLALSVSIQYSESFQKRRNFRKSMG